MLTTGQVANMMAGQNQYFAGAAQYSQQISASMPGVYSQPGSGAYSAPPGQSFAANFGNTATSAMGGAAQFALGAGSLAAGMGMMGSVGGAMLDPFVGGGAMYRMGGRMGMGMMGRLGMGALGMAPAAGVLALGGHAIGSMVAGAQEQSAVENAWNRHQFISPMGSSRGRADASSVGAMMRKVAAAPEIMTSMGELTRIMDKMGGMGMMTGMQNVNEFERKFKESINVLKEMSRVIGSSMEEALPMFGEIKRTGFYQTKDILQNAMSRQITGGITGMNQQQVGGLAAAGSHMSFQTGGTRATGARHALRMANQLGAAKSIGALSEGDIMEMTGQGGAAGIQALSQQLTSAGYRMSRGALGTATSIALAEVDDEGRFTGSMDENLMTQFRSGAINRSDLMQMAKRKTRSRAAKMSYVAQRQRLRSEMAGEMGVEGQMAMLQNILGERGFNNPDAMRIVSQRFGLGEREADMMVELGKRMPDIRSSMRGQSRSQARKLAAESVMAESGSWDAIKSKIGKRIGGAITEPFKELGAGIRDSIANAVDDFVDDVTGRYKVRVSQQVAGLVQEASSGVSASRKRVARLYGESGGIGGLFSGADMRAGGLRGAANFLTGESSAGEDMAATMGMVGGGRYLTGGTGGGINRFTDTAGATNEQIQKARQALTAMGRGELSEAGSMAAGLLDFNKGSLRKKLMAGVREARLGGMNMENLSGRERVMALDKAMRSGSAGAAYKDVLDLMVARGGGEASGYTSDLLGALEAGKGEGLGTGLKDAFQSMGMGLSDFRNTELLARQAKSAREELRGVLDDAGLSGELEGLMENVEDGSLDLLFSGVAGGDRSDMIDVDSMGNLGRRKFMRKDAQGNFIRREGRALELRGQLGAKDRQLAVSKGMAGLLGKYARQVAAGASVESFSKPVQSLIEMQQKSFDAMVPGEKIKQILLKRADGDELSKADKEFLKQKGLKSDISQEEASKLGSLMSKLAGVEIDNPRVMGLLKKARGVVLAQNFAGVAAQFADRGKTLGETVGKLQKAFTGTKDEEAVSSILGDLGGLAKDLQGNELAVRKLIGDEEVYEEGDGISERFASAGIALANRDISDRAKRAIMGADEDLAAAFSRASMLKGRIGKRKKVKLGRLMPGFENLSESQQDELLSRATAGGDKAAGIDTMVDRDEFAEIQKLAVATDVSKGLITPGTEEYSKFANPAEVASKMAEFAKNTTELASMIEILKKGKEEEK